MRQAALALAVCGVLLTAACGKDKPAPKGEADVQGALAAAAEAERRRFSELKAEVSGLEPSAVLKAEVFKEVVAGLTAPPSDEAAKEDLVAAVVGLERALLWAYLLSDGPVTLPAGVEGVSGELISAPAVARAVSVLLEKAAAVAPAGGPGASELAKLLETNKGLAGAPDDLAGRDALNKAGSAPDVAVGLGLKYAGRAAATLMEGSAGAPPEVLSTTLGPLACEQCTVAGNPVELLDTPLEKGGLGCADAAGGRSYLAPMGGCSLPSSAAEVPTGYSQRISISTIVAARGLAALVQLADPAKVPPALTELQAKAQKALVKVRLPVLPAILPGVAPEGATGPTIWTLLADRSGLPLATPPQYLLVLGPQGVELVQVAFLRVRDNKVVWDGGGSKLALSAEDAGLKGKAYNAALARGVEILTGDLRVSSPESAAPAAEGAGDKAEKPAPTWYPYALAVDTRITPALYTAAVEVMRAAQAPPPTVMLTPSHSKRGIPIWLADVAPVPEGLKTSGTSVTRTREGLLLTLGEAPSALINPEAKLGVDGIEVRLAKKSRKKKTKIVEVKLSEGAGTPTETLLATAVSWIEGDGNGAAIDGGELKAPGLGVKRWQPILGSFARGTTAAGDLAWLKPALDCAAPTCAVRPVVLHLAQRKRQKKPVKTAVIKEQAPALGYCKAGDIKSVMQRRTGAFRFCYERRLQLRPELKGRVTVQFIIGEDGRVVSAKKSKDTTKDREIAPCLIKNIKKLRFPKPEGGRCAVRWPFKFQ